MGARGPIPKRMNTRLGHVTKAEKDSVTTVDMVGKVEAPPVDANWHELARDWYESLARSGQAKHYEPSDWTAARLLAHEMTRMLKAKASATMLNSIWTAM